MVLYKLQIVQRVQLCTFHRYTLFVNLFLLHVSSTYTFFLLFISSIYELEIKVAKRKADQGIVFYNFVWHYVRRKWKEKVSALIDFFVLRRVQVYKKKLVKEANFFLRVYQNQKISTTLNILSSIIVRICTLNYRIRENVIKSIRVN